ncbi:MAG: transglycosylase SLT domain-containing protein, partial [Gammaproteobacteria bacterium]|nr:transglycosylase SLT domain-containing protein [Gammaproteobacteria bacterium]
PQILADLESRKSILRARELFLVGLEGRGRSEWDAAIALLQPDEMRQAAILAHSWGWHSRAIAAAARTGNYDDLDLRYPLPWSDKFEQHSRSARVRPSWAYGVARSESLFMRDVRSHAGAIGLMQLMPETGRETAQEVNLPFSGVATLTNPDSNIRLGTTYLAKMYEKFSDSHVLATAAYNAGPFAVQRWLPGTGEIDARIWIENIPYNETRKYVRRVLTTDAIFHWRLSGDTRRITANLSAIRPLDDGPVASAK